MSVHDTKLVEAAAERSRPDFIIRLRAEPHVSDPVRALRFGRKRLRRGFGLRCH